jgi:N-methylhydantoinase B
VIAGGTDIYPAHAARRAWGEPTHKDVLDITAIPSLDRIEEDAAGWRIGCLVTWSALRAAALPPLFDGLKAAAREVGGLQVQNRGTVVGNLVTASPAGDGHPEPAGAGRRGGTAGPAGGAWWRWPSSSRAIAPPRSARRRSSRRCSCRA